MNTSKPSHRILEFDQFRLDTAERLLLHAGKPIPVTPKAFETLLALVQNSGRVVTKDDLMKQVWPDAVVEEASLARQVWILRKALGGDGGLIETVPKLGYRFTAVVREAHSATAAAPLVPEVQQADVDERPVATAPAAPSKPRPYALAMAMITVVLASAGLVSVVFARFWREPVRPGRSEPPAAGFLTDGSHADSAGYWVATGRIYFTRAVTNTRVEGWMMNADGSDQRRANGGIPSLLSGRWSPDESKVVFTNDDGTGVAYLADANGANRVELPFIPGNMDWSPDGSRFVYQATGPSGTPEIHLYTLGTRAIVRLTPNLGGADPSFSPDGRRVAFTSWRDGNADIYVMESDGTNLQRVTMHPAFDNYPVFSPDGTQIAFQSNREDEHVEIYLQNLNDHNPPRRLTRSKTQTGFLPKSWSPDGTRMLVYSDDSGKSRIRVIDVEPFPFHLVLGDEHADLGSPRLSADGTRLLYEARRSDRSVELRVTELSTGSTKRLFATALDYPVNASLEATWSPDGARIAFCELSDGNSEIMVMNADGGGLRNITRSPLRDTSPVFSADGLEIVFARDIYGMAQLYRMDVNGADQRRITHASGYEMKPAVSPDGRRLAFAGDRTTRGLDILLLDVADPGSERVLAARRSHDSEPVFSPDGGRIAFVSMSDGNAEIYIVNADGTGLVRLTHSRDAEAAPQFSRDGRRLLFSSQRAGRFAIYEIELEDLASGTQH